jgi:hypothetical protein
MIGRSALSPCLIVATCIALTACAEEAAPNASIMGNQSSACLGRHAFEMPAALAAGAHEPDFLQHSYGFAGISGLMGGISIGSTELVESIVTDLPTFNGTVRAQAFGSHHKTLILKGLDKDGNMRHDYRLIPGSQALDVRYPNSFAWRHLDDFSFGTWLEADQRVRLIKGKLSNANVDRQSASSEVQTLWSRYRPRKAADLPAQPGICTPYGFVADTQAQRGAPLSAYASYRDESQPALIYTVSLSPAETSGEKLEDLPQPWRETTKEAKERREQSKRKGEWLSIGAGALVEKYLEPEYLTVAGQRARLSGVKFRPSMDQYDYEVQIETLGDPSDPKKPRIIVMAQGLKAKYYTGLQGQPPAPPLEQVLPTLKAIAQSMRVR